ncbi:aquaporin [Nocardia pseudovaccinii]|uniref:aquaporin n=1 Tax=Nocardia pseudovaccinii TaxID=189540 RepID=UPI0027D8AE09|nr:aquaporin [Nocardia pseudovaccinii]
MVVWFARSPRRGQLWSSLTHLFLVRVRIEYRVGLGVLIPVFGPIPGAHFNPVVSVANRLLGRHNGTGLGYRELAGYVLAQTVGAIAGSMLANTMFDRITSGHLAGEVVATAGLIASPIPPSPSGVSSPTPSPESPRPPRPATSPPKYSAPQWDSP